MCIFITRANKGESNVVFKCLDQEEKLEKKKQHSNSGSDLFLKTELYAVQPKIYQPGVRKASQPQGITYSRETIQNRSPLSKPDTASEADVKYTRMCSE